MISRVVLLLCLNAIVITALSQYSFNQLSVNEGLTHSDVVAVVQDTSGIIWLGTNNGLNRYDGYTFKVFKHDFEDSLSLPSNRIKNLFCDSRNRIWIATQKSSLSYYEPATGYFYDVPLGKGKNYSEWVKQIMEDEEGNLWYLTNRGSLNKLEWRDDHYQTVGFFMPLEFTISEILAFDSRIWIGTRRSGLWELNPQNGKISRVTGPFRSAYSMNVLDDTLIVASDQGLYKMAGKKGWEKLFHWEDKFISDIAIDYNRDIWVGFFNGGVLRLQAQSGKYADSYLYTACNHLITNRINDLLIGAFDILWIGTSGGGVHFADLRSKPFKTINSENTAVPDNYITAIYEDEGNLWIGTRNGLARSCISGEISYYEKGRHISALYKDRSGQFWVGTRFNGLRCLEENGSMQKFNRWQERGLSSNEVIGIDEDSFGRLWIVTFRHGMTLMDARTKKVLAYLNRDNYLPTNNLTYVYPDPVQPDVTWVGTRDAGLLKLSCPEISQVSVEQYQFDRKDPSSISSNYVWPILRTSGHELWVGTIGGGLNKLVETDEGVLFQHFTEKDGLADNDVESILVDNDGNLWIGGKGLVQFDPIRNSIVAYDVNDGLQSNSFKIGAAFKNQQGLLYFGGINGLNYFDPQEITANLHTPKVIFDDLKIFNRRVTVGERVNNRILLPKKLNYLPEITLKASENQFTIDLLGLHYSNPGQNKYAYKLEGYSQDWTYHEADQRHITFSNLKAGTYRFNTRVSNSDGKWSDIRSLIITILPPWWAAWWAFIIYAFIIFVLLYIYGFLMRRQSALKHELLLAEKEKDLNHQKIKFFTNISHEIRTPLTLIHGPLEEIIVDGPGVCGFLEKLNLIRKNVDRLLALTNQLLNFGKMDSGKMTLQAAEGNIVKFAQEIFLVFRHAAKERGIAYTFEVARNPVKLTFDRDKFEIVLTNLISNAFKYTKAGGKVDVLLRPVGKDTKDAVFEKVKSKTKLSNNYLEITIRDNGIGMSKGDVGKIFDHFYQVKDLDTLSIHGTGIGLSLVKGIVDLHKGEIKVKSAKGKGSGFTLKIPFGSAHFDASSLLEDFKDSDHRAHYDVPGPGEQIVSSEIQPGMKRCILIVEDNKDVLTYLNSHLERTYKVITALNGRQGLEKARRHLPDFIISDVMMPEMDGLEMLSLIKKDPDLSFIPVILLTARTAMVYELEGVGAGAHDYIHKPFNIKVLLAKITSILATRENFKIYYKAHINLRSNATASLPNAEQKFLDDITNLVIDNLVNDDFSVQMMVRAMGMSQSACYKRIKELTGRSAVQFIRDIRLRRAAKLLNKGELNVSEVAFSVGINDLKYFREKFKEQYGCNPSDYQAKDVETSGKDSNS